MAFGDWTIQVKIGEDRHRLFRVSFEKDGTYSVAAPYHKANEAIVFKAMQFSDLEQRFVDLSSWHQVDLSESRICFSHHPDGIMDIVSGASPLINSRGHAISIRGVVFVSDDPPTPSFTCMVDNVKEFPTDEGEVSAAITFDINSVSPLLDSRSLIFNGAYFSEGWREFLVPDEEGWNLRLVHANRAVITLRALLSAPGCQNQGFIGVNIFQAPTPTDIEGGFLLRAIGVERTENEKTYTENIYCMYPAPALTGLFKSATATEH